MKPCRRSHHFVWLASSLGSGLWLLLTLALGSCTNAAPPADPYAAYRPALKAAFQQDLELLGPVPRYAISATLDPAENYLFGSARITVPNNSNDPWTYLIFRLYPMLRHYGGNLVVQSALVEDRPTPFVYLSENTAVRLDLDVPLLSGREVSVTLTWRLEFPRWNDQTAVYALFGRSQQMVSLPLFYPALAVYTDGPTLGTGQWWLDIGSERGDSAFHPISLFSVTLTLPASWVAVTSGTEVASEPIGDQARRVYVTGPSREFLIHASPLFNQVTTEAYGTRVTSYYLPGEEAAGRAALRYTAQALRIYSDRFGGYPFVDLRVAPAPINYRGMEYPQVILLGVETYGRFRDRLELLAAHETAHQWWYQIVHNDPVNDPWLDEALAEFSMRLYIQDLRGNDQAEQLVRQRWRAPVEGLRSRSQDAAVDQPVQAFLNGSQYETIVYAKGAIFWEIVRARVGERQFDRFLRSYVERYRWQIVDTEQWLNELNTLSDPALFTLFEEWIRQPLPEQSVRQPPPAGAP
jgi:hypothetical protein